jgi:Protein of unknown function (DUF1460)
MSLLDSTRIIQLVFIVTAALLQCQSAEPPTVQSTTEAQTSACLSFNWVATARDSALFLTYLEVARQQPDLNAQVLAVAKKMIGTPYVGGTLDRYKEEERLQINLRGVDCWTSVEQCVAVGLSTRDSVADFACFAQHLRRLRYRDGLINGYGSRLHYFSEWVDQAIRAGILRELTTEWGGVPYEKSISFMTDNRRLYPHLNDSIAFAQVLDAQTVISRYSISHIPKSKVGAVEKQLREGDLVVITSVKSNLDVEHEGFAIRGQNGRMYLLHASSSSGRMRLSSVPIPDYLKKVPAMAGIRVLRVGE